MVDVVNALILETFSKKSTLLLAVVRLLLVVTPILLTARTAPLLGIFVKLEPSPTNLA